MNNEMISNYTIERTPRRVLLFSPAIYDVRFPWGEWQQPTGLLQMATALKRSGCDLRLIDALFCPGGEPLSKQLVRKLTRGGIAVNYWRWGQKAAVLHRQIGGLQEAGWYPEEAFLLSVAACQWEGCHEAVSLVRQVFPKTRIALYGEWPTRAPLHAAATSGADQLISGPIQELVGLPLDLSLYPRRPRIARLSIGSTERPVADMLNEFLLRVTPASRSERIGHIILDDYDAFRRFPEHIQALCQIVPERNISVSLHAFGGVHPRIFSEHPELAASLKRAGLKQVIFTSDRDVPFTTEAWSAFVEVLSEAVARCEEAGYRLRTEDLVASACLGRPQEDLVRVAARVLELAHVSGSVILLPYLALPDEHASSLPLEEANGRLFQFAEANGYTYREYLDLLGLGALLNAKHRTRTFDFLGASLVSRLARQSLVTESWRPPDSQGQPVTLGYFGKDGKWVKRPL